MTLAAGMYFSKIIFLKFSLEDKKTNNKTIPGDLQLHVVTDPQPKEKRNLNKGFPLDF